MEYSKVGSYVIIRSAGSGVWFAKLDGYGKDLSEVHLSEARKVWSWQGANTTSDLAAKGLDSTKSRVADPVNVSVTGVLEIISATPSAAEAFAKARWKA